jgi:TusA-related sulfurtransferase/uncharacterized OsmC-like protein
MSASQTLRELIPDIVFDGGDLDCGSGLVLMIRENMLKTPVGGVLEMRSSEPTVGDDLPPWCRMAGHEFLGRLDEAAFTRYFLRRGAPQAQAEAAGAADNPLSEEERLAKDKEAAKAYVWRLRARVTGPMKATVYCRNFSWHVGQPLSFEEKDANPSAVESLLGTLGGALATGFSTECGKEGLDVDDIELAVTGRLHNPLAHLGLEDGDPSFAEIEVKCYASTMDEEARARALFETVVARSPIAATLAKATQLNVKFSVV